MARICFMQFNDLYLKRVKNTLDIDFIMHACMYTLLHQLRNHLKLYMHAVNRIVVHAEYIMH